MNTKFSRRITASLLALALVAPAIAQHGPPPPPPPAPYIGKRGWDAVPEGLRAVERHGYLDGLQGAEHDRENHRMWNVNNRAEFRHPQVAGKDHDEYCEGFKRGYYAAVEHYQGIR